MKTLTTLLTLALVALFVVGIFYGGYMGVDYLWDLYAGLDATLRIVLVSAMSVILLAAFVVAGAVKAAARTATQASLASEKFRIYSSLVGIYRRYLESAQQTAELQHKTLQELSALDADMLIIASSYVLAIHGKMQKLLDSHEQDGKISDLYQQLVKNIRRDLGHGSGHDEAKLSFTLSSGKKTDDARPSTV